MRRFQASSVVIAVVLLSACAICARAAENPGTFQVTGEVRKPGTYPMQGKTSLSAAIKRAGGLTKRADYTQVTLVRKSSDGETETTVYDLTNALAVSSSYAYGGQERHDPFIAAGDVVSVPIDPWTRPVTVEFKNTPLPTAVETLIKDSGINYAIDPRLESARVSAKLNDVTLREAVITVVKAAGAQLTIGSSSFTVSSTPGMMGPVTDAVQPAQPPADAGPRVTAVISLRYLNASDAAQLLGATPGIRIARSTDNALVVEGEKDAVETLKQLVGALDKPEALPRSVKIGVKAEVRVKQAAMSPQAKLALTEAEIALKAAADAHKSIRSRYEAGLLPADELQDAEEALKLAEARYNFAKEQAQTGPAQFSASTQSAGLEGSQVRLDILAGKPESGDVQLRAILTPVILTEPAANGKEPVSTISLTGKGMISGRVPFPFSKEFDIAVSLAPGEQKSVASGSAQTPDGELTFDVIVHAAIEEGRVKPAQGSQPPANPDFVGGGGFPSGGGGRSW